METDLQKAIDFATLCHKGQKRRDGRDYIEHPLEVMRMVPDELKIVAVLHDTIEDTTCFYDIKSGTLNFKNNTYRLSYKEASILDSLTRTKDETYIDYIQKICNSVYTEARIIKIADTVCNLLDSPSDRQRVKYRESMKILLGGI